MADLISVLIVDDNSDICELLHENIDNTGDMRVIGTAEDGRIAVSMIHELEPDIVLLDIILPKLDGIGVLEEINWSMPFKRPVMCIFTAIGSDIVIKKALERGADFYIMKPFNMDVLITRIRQLYNEKRSAEECTGGTNGGPYNAACGMQSEEQIISSLIKSIGITPNLAGYNYLREAVLIAVNQPELQKNVSKTIYPLLAREHGTNVRNIDRAIRCAILSAQNKTKNADNFNRENFIMVSNIKNTSNAQMIRFLAEKAMQKLSGIK